MIDATFIPIGTAFPISYVSASSWYADLSLASDYILTITDQNGSLSKYLYSVMNDIPSLGLDTAIASTKKQSFCSLYPTDSRCPDGSNLLPTLLTHSVGGVA